MEEKSLTLTGDNPPTYRELLYIVQAYRKGLPGVAELIKELGDDDKAQEIFDMIQYEFFHSFQNGVFSDIAPHE